MNNSHNPNNSNMQATANAPFMKDLRFVKEKGLWYADLPEFLALGLGTRNNLLMVDGADTFLDFLSKNTSEVTITISPSAFAGYEGELGKIKIGKNQQLLNEVGHAPVNYGAYYDLITWLGAPFTHRLWLCPVAEWVFGNYPDTIFIKIVK